MTDGPAISLDQCSYWTVTMKRDAVTWIASFSDFDNARVIEWIFLNCEGNRFIDLAKFQWTGIHRDVAEKIAIGNSVRVAWFIEKIIRLDRGDMDNNGPVKSMLTREEDSICRVLIPSSLAFARQFEIDLFCGECDD